jgi:hypothetical protein
MLLIDLPSSTSGLDRPMSVPLGLSPVPNRYLVIIYVQTEAFGGLA